MTFDEIKSDIYFQTGATSATYPTTDLVRNVNIAYNNVARLIWENADGWQYDDTNATTLPLAKTTLVDNQQDYELPSSCQRVLRVEVQDNSGNWTKLKPIDIHDVQVALPEYNDQAGLPIYYDVLGRSVLLYPKPASGDVTLASGMAVYFDRDVTPFPVSAGTGHTPGFATPFHRILSYAASIDFEQDVTEKRNLMTLKQNLEESLKNFYGKRNVERNSAVRPARRKGWLKYT